MKKLFYLFGIFLVMSCGVTVDYDYEKSTDFSTYKTYNYFDNMQTGLSELDSKRFFAALNEALALKGFTLSETPDFIIDIKSETFQSTQSSSVGVGVGSGGGGVSVGIPIGQGSLSRQIIFDFVDGQTQHLFWQAISSESDAPNDNPEERIAKFKAVVTKVLEAYPPKKE